jgi:hypothetical protein
MLCRKTAQKQNKPKPAKGKIKVNYISFKLKKNYGRKTISKITETETLKKVKC